MRRLLGALGFTLLIVASGCSESGATEESASGVEGDGTLIRETAPETDAVLDELLNRFGLDAEQGARDVRAELRDLLVPEGTLEGNEAFIDALAARLGPEFAGERSLDVLLDALLVELGDADISSIDQLLDAVSKWASSGVVTIGGPSSGGTIDLTTSFDDAVAILDAGGAGIDLIDGLRPVELRDVDIEADADARTIRLTSWVPAPISGEGSVTITWTGETPGLDLQITRPSLAAAELLPGVELGEAGRIGIYEVSLDLDATGLSLQGQVVPSSVPGIDDLDPGNATVPAEFHFPGFGPLSLASSDFAVDVSIPLGSLDTLASWNTARDGLVQLTLGADWTVGYGERLTAVVGDDTLIFVGEASVGENNGALRFALTGEWSGALGLEWLTLDDVELALSTGASTTATVRADFVMAGKSGSLEFTLEDGDDGRSVAVVGSLESLTLDDLVSITDTLTGDGLVPDGLDLPDDLFALRDITVSFETSPTGTSFSMGATTTVLGQQAEAMFAVFPTGDGESSSVVAVRPDSIRLADLLPVLDGNELVGDLSLPSTALVLTSGDVRRGSEDLGAAATAFFSKAHGTPNFDLDLGAGLSLLGNVPGGVAEPIDDLKELLGMERNAPLVLSGTIPGGALGGSGGVAGFELNALLPKMEPDGSWFVSAQLGLRITGEPSVGLVGKITLDIEGDVQTFEIEAAISRTSTGVAVELIGRLDGPWATPFDVEWLTLNEVVLKLGFGPTGVSIGFLGDLQIGQKDIRGAVAITISPTGVPTNFIFEASSEAGIGLGDLADLYALMSGEARPPVESVLPDVEIRNIALRFAPQGDPDLGVEQGFRVAGELWMSTTIGGPLERLVGVDVEVSDSGVRAAGFLAGWDLGPLAFDDANVLVEVSAARQRFAISGGVHVVDNGIDVTLDVSRTAFSFETNVEVTGGRAGLVVEAAYDTTNPSFTVTAVMDEQFIQNLDGSFETLLGSKISDLNSQISTARTGLDAANIALSAAKAGLKIAKAAVEVSGCGWPFSGLCDAVDDWQDDVDDAQDDVNGYKRDLNRGEDLLDRYDIQLTLVSAEFSASLSAFEAGSVTMSLVVDANGVRVPVPVGWDFAKSIDANLSGVLDTLVPA